MPIWENKEECATRKDLGKSVSFVVARGASREEWIACALDTLLREPSVQRAGVWLAPPGQSATMQAADDSFRGLVWEKDSRSMPREWARLSPEPPLPAELLRGERSVEIDLKLNPNTALLGPVSGLRRVVWTPIASARRLRGLLLAGSQRKQGDLPHATLESVAAELALALELETERRVACERQSDAQIARQTLSALDSRQPYAETLLRLAASCVESGAVFAALGEAEGNGKNATEQPVHFLWKAGEEELARSVDSEPIAWIWKTALLEQRVTGSEPRVRCGPDELLRVIALPLAREGQAFGVLVAGFPHGVASLSTLERLELRASLATLVLARKRSRDKEDAAAARAHTVFSANREAVVLFDSEGRLEVLSRGAQELFPEPRSGFLTEHGTAAAPPSGTVSAKADFAGLFRVADRERIAAWTKRLAAGEFSEAETQPEAVLSNGVSVRFHNIVPAGAAQWAVALEPMPGRKASASPAAELELHAVLEWLEQGVVLFDAQDRVREMNIRFAQIAGLAPEEIGRLSSLDSLISRLAWQAADPPGFAERWRQLARGAEGGARDELQLLRPAPRVLERASRPILDASGQRLGRVEIYRDLTAQRVFQSKLLQTEKLAALGQMVTGVAHELSNPLTTILGYAQRLLLRGDSAGHSPEARKILQEAERATVILRQVLLNARESRPERRPVSVNQIALHALELQRFGLAAEKIRVELDLAPALPLVNGDAGQLQQVLMNLIGNARQALEESASGGSIRIRTRLTDDHHVAVDVIDDGPGIPEAIRARIFDPFFTTKPAGVGTGLGLAIVLSIVREHGGRVNVESPPGRGAHFSIELPAAAAGATLAKEPAAPRLAKELRANCTESFPPEPATAAAENSSRVLVVEDEPTVARLIADVLEDEGYRVDVLLDGKKALERASRVNYSLVICDMKMPGLDGQSFYKALEEAGSPLRKKFLFVTGDVIAAQTQDFLERHRLPHVAKPFRVEELTEKVKHALSPASGNRPDREPAARKSVARNG